MYFLIQLMSLYLPPDFPAPYETMLNPVYWKAGLPSFEDLKRRATEAARKTADDLLKDSKQTNVAEDSPSPTTPPESASKSPPAVMPDKAMCPECFKPVNTSQTGKLVTTSADILPITLPLYRGLPISHVWHRLQTNSVEPMNIQQTNMLRWLMLMHVAKQPKLLENNAAAAMVAAANLPSAQWPQYLFCGYTAPHCQSLVESLNNQPVIGHGSTRILKAWKGKNQQEQDSSHRAFVERYGKLLASQAPVPPQDIYVVAEASLNPILANTGGIPISSGPFLSPTGSSKDPNRLSKLPLAWNYSALVPNRLPKTLPCNGSRCKEILDATRVQGSYETYPVYLLTKVRLTNVQGSGISSTSESQAAILGDIEVYADKQLTRKLHQFDSLAPDSASTPASLPSASDRDTYVAHRQNPPGSVDDFANVYYQRNKGDVWRQGSVNAKYLLVDPGQRYSSVLRLCVSRGYAAIKLVSRSGKEAIIGCIGSSPQEIDNNVFNAIMGFK